MLAKLKQIFTEPLSLQTAEVRADDTQSRALAAVALMVEIIAVDDAQHDVEKQMLRALLQRQFDVRADEAEALIAQAEHAHQAATDFYRFTSEINRQFSAEEKIELIESLWQLAWADEELHALEQHVIRRLANLLHVSHKDFIAAKLRVVGK
jgi:uncharacterized tellurite resistance protein B-like protein